MTAQTQLQQDQQNEVVNTNLAGMQSYSVLPGSGDVVYPGMAQWDELGKQAQAHVKKYPVISPPSDGEITKQMWVGSIMTAVMAGLATGNPASAIVAGMVGALGIHDHGYALRQRGEYVHQLQDEGYSFPAILAWYKTGDTKDLDKETELMHQSAEAKLNRDQQATFHTDEITQRGLDRDAADRRQHDAQSNQWSIAKMHEAGANARAVEAAKAAGASGFKQQEMERRQSLMKGATLDADQYKAMTRSKAAAMKAAADIAQGTPISEQQLELMGQLIDAPNASVKLTQTHHISAGAAHGMLDRAKQYLNKNIAGGGDLTDEQASELMDVINAGHAAQEQSYYEQVGSQASQITNPQEWQNFAIATGLSPAQLSRAVDAYNAAEQAAKAVPFGQGAAVGDGSTTTKDNKITYGAGK